MHPILFHIPLPNRPLKLWWALVAVAVLSALYGIWAQRRSAKEDALTGLVIAAAAGAGAYYWRASDWTAPTGGVPEDLAAKLSAATGGRVTNLKGGLPIMVDGQVIGGIGVGSGTGDQDREVGNAALAALAGALTFKFD